jgi:hypothetical protein
LSVDRLKLPAYGKRLLDHRRLHCHPTVVQLYWGDDWSLPRTAAAAEVGCLANGMRPYAPSWFARCGFPWLAVRPGQFSPASLDWRVTAGLLVRVVVVADESPGFWAMLGEVATWASCVEIYEDEARGTDVQSLAFDQVVRGPDGRMVWPDWWPERMNADYAKRRRQWCDDARAALPALRAAA